MAWYRAITPEAQWMAWWGTKEPFSPVVFGWLTTTSCNAGSTTRVRFSSTCFRCAMMSAFWRKNTIPKNTASWEIFRRRSLIWHLSTVLSTLVASKRGQRTTVAKLNRRANGAQTWLLLSPQHAPLWCVGGFVDVWQCGSAKHTILDRSIVNGKNPGPVRVPERGMKKAGSSCRQLATQPYHRTKKTGHLPA